MKATAEKLRRHRKALGHTLEHAAQALGVTYSTVCRWESGRIPRSQPMQAALDAYLRTRKGDA